MSRPRLLVACLAVALLLASTGCLGVADDATEGDDAPETGLDALADGADRDPPPSSGGASGAASAGDADGGASPSEPRSGTGTAAASAGATEGSAVPDAAQPEGPAPPTVVVRWVRRGALLPGVADADPVRAPEGREFVVANVSIRRDDGLAGDRPVSAAMRAGGDRYARADVAHSRALPTELRLEPDAAATGLLVFAVPEAATPDALGVAVGDVTEDSTRRLPVRRVGALGHDDARLAIVGHNVYTTETLASTYGVEEILPRLRNAGDLPTTVTRVELVLGEDRASCAADTTVPPGELRTVTMDCRWRDMAPGDEPEVDPGSYDVRVTVFENDTAAASRTLNVSVPAE